MAGRAWSDRAPYGKRCPAAPVEKGVDRRCGTGAGHGQFSGRREESERGEWLTGSDSGHLGSEEPDRPLDGFDHFQSTSVPVVPLCVAFASILLNVRRGRNAQITLSDYSAGTPLASEWE